MHRDGVGGYGVGGIEAHSNLANDNGGHAYGPTNGGAMCSQPQGLPHGVVGGSMAEEPLLPSSLSLTGLAPLDFSLGSLSGNALFGSLNLVCTGL